MVHTVFKPNAQMPPAPATIIHRLRAAGFEAFAVGGCVRDTLLGLSPDDWDITTNALPAQVATVFADCHVIGTGLQHGTLTVRYDGKSFEVTTYRVDGAYADRRHPNEVTFTPSAREDAKRRDFTINALLWDPKEGIRDFTGGIADLENRLLRCVGDAHIRFSEDALRILRALRFAAVYGFQIEKNTGQAAVLLANTLRVVSAERIRTELFKLICGEYADTVLREFAAVFRHILPEVSLTEQLLQTLARTPRDPVCRLSLLLQDTNATAVLMRLKTDHATIAKVVNLISALPFPPTTDFITLKKRLKTHGKDALFASIRLQIARQEKVDAWLLTEQALQQLLSTSPCVSLADLAVNGNDLKMLGLHGKHIGEMLCLLLDAVIEERCENEKNALLAFAKKQVR